jgi:hypothetical protein
VFATDIVLSFFTAYYDQEVLITDHKMIARNYLRFGPICASTHRSHSLPQLIISLVDAVVSDCTVAILTSVLLPFVQAAVLGGHHRLVPI